MVRPPTALRVALAVATSSATIIACSSSERRPQDAAPPANASLVDILPRPSADVPFQVTRGSVFVLTPSSGPLSPGLTGATAYDVASVPAEDAGEPIAPWRFGLDDTGLRVALGDETMDGARQRLAAALTPLLARTELRAALAAAVGAQPSLQGLDLASAWTTDGLTLDHVSLADGHLVDTDSDGVMETTRSVLTLHLSLPAVQSTTPAAPFPACDALLGDGSAAAAMVTAEGQSYVAPSEATWGHFVAIVIHVTLEDLGAAHAALWTPTSYVSRGEREAAAHDLALFRQFFQDPVAHLVGADVAVSLVPLAALQHRTLSVVAALARSSGDAGCLRQVDGWMAEPAIIASSLTTAHLAGTEAPPLMVQSYDATFDGLDGDVDPGLVCLRDLQGTVVVVGGQEPACSTPSGPLTLVQESGLGAGSVGRIVTPYARLEKERRDQPALVIAPCTAAPWKDLCTERFGRGIRLCLGDWALRNQVGDYWNIHWTQSVRKAAAQTAIKAGGYILRGIVIFYLGSGEVIPRLQVIVASEGSAYLGDVVAHFTGSKVAGYSISGYGAYVAYVWQKVFTHLGLIEKSPNVVESFVAERVVDGLAQMLEVTAVGWQDYSDGSRGMCGFQSH